MDARCRRLMMLRDSRDTAQEALRVASSLATLSRATVALRELDRAQLALDIMRDLLREMEKQWVLARSTSIHP